MKELNKQNLQQAILDLPQYDPKPIAWNHIQQGIADIPLSTAIQELPEIDPPEGIWNNIQTEINRPAKKAKIVAWKYWSAAAGFALLLSTAWMLNKNINTSNTLTATISYSVEEMDDSLLNNDWNADDEQFAVLDDLCSQHPFMCNRPDIQNLRMELTELSAAKTELVQVLGPYGTDINLIEQLNEIEMERTKLLKQILTQVI